MTFILVGPDGAGKTTLSTRLEVNLKRERIHYTQHSQYSDYMEQLIDINFSQLICDRFAYCEVPYHKALGREFVFKRKEWHNIILWSLSYNPVIILCTHKPTAFEYGDTYLPFHLWDEIMQGYMQWFKENHIDYVPYEYTHYISECISPVSVFSSQESIYNSEVAWAMPFRQSGYCFTGSPHPKVLIIAERIGPNNIHNIPFETGPTGRQMTEFFDYAQLSLGDIAITNMVKSKRGDMRKPNDHDVELLEIELDNLKPQSILLMGAVSKAGEKAIKARKIPYKAVSHFGYYNHAGMRDLRPVYEQYTGIINGLLGKEPIKKDIL